MALLARLRPLVCVCQLIGIFPFSMEYCKTRNVLRFKRFAFSYFHPLTVWFCLIALAQTFFTYVSIRSAISFFNELASDLSLPFVAVLVQIALKIIPPVQHASTRSLLVYYSKIKSAIFLICDVSEKMKELLTESELYQFYQLILVRIFAGILLLLFAVRCDNKYYFWGFC